MDNGRTHGFSGQEEVKYSDVVSGGEGTTIVIRISGGRAAKVEVTFMVPKNANRSYPICGVPDDVWVFLIAQDPSVRWIKKSCRSGYWKKSYFCLVF